MDIAPLLRHMVEMGASDLHLKAGLPPVVRVDGDLHRTQFAPLTAEDTEAVGRELLPPQKEEEFRRTHEADVGYMLDRGSRFRVNVFRQRGVVGWPSAGSGR